VKGWHPTGVFGAVAAAAAVAYLNGLPPSVGSHALGLAASMSSGLVANFGSMAKAMHAGRAASCGIEAVHLAMLGFTASPDVFEHPAGFLKAFSPAGRVDVDSPVEIAPADPAILRTGLSIKQYPICYSSHRVVDAVLDIVSDLDLRGDDIEQVDVAIGLPQAVMLRNHAPVTGLEAKFSLEFAVAASIVSRALKSKPCSQRCGSGSSIRCVPWIGRSPLPIGWSSNGRAVAPVTLEKSVFRAATP
jgi:aconitate decarboxylase